MHHAVAVRATALTQAPHQRPDRPDLFLGAGVRGDGQRGRRPGAAGRVPGNGRMDQGREKQGQSDQQSDSPGWRQAVHASLLLVGYS